MKLDEAMTMKDIGHAVYYRSPDIDITGIEFAAQVVPVKSVIFTTQLSCKSCRRNKSPHMNILRPPPLGYRYCLGADVDYPPKGNPPRPRFASDGHFEHLLNGDADR